MSVYVGKGSSVQLWTELVPPKPAHLTVTYIEKTYTRYQGCSKHVENCNKYILKKNCASSWLFTSIVSLKIVLCIENANKGGGGSV